ncbi:MAG: DEAD/DEAH box helicase [Desulfobacterales bacterium]|nr:DEAD/DEAH box helicase [Desulfobacterales bacterium]
MNYSNWNVPRTLKYYVSDNGHITAPRGYIRQLIGLCRRYDVKYEMIDARRVLDSVKFNFKGKLRPYQEYAVSDVLGNDFGVLSAPPGSGKTTMALFVISERKQPTLIVVHTKELLNQWIDRIETFLQIPTNEIGIIGNGQKRIGEKITVALIQSLYKCADEVSKSIGFLIVDENHRTPSRTFSEAVTAFDCKYMLGLSATPYRRDGLSRLIYWHLGDVVHEIKAEELIETGDILKAEVIFRDTNFNTSLNASEQYSTMLSELTRDSKRNALIVSDVITEARNGGGTCLILSDRKQHCETFKVLFRGHGIKAELLTGDISNKDREDIVDRLNNGKVKVLISTTQLLSEGFDSKQLSTLFLASPIKFSGRLIQSVGRILRPMQNKQAKIYDYIDSKVGVLAASANSRRQVYGR